MEGAVDPVLPARGLLVDLDVIAGLHQEWPVAGHWIVAEDRKVLGQGRVDLEAHHGQTAARTQDPEQLRQGRSLVRGVLERLHGHDGVGALIRQPGLLEGSLHEARPPVEAGLPCPLSRRSQSRLGRVDPDERRPRLLGSPKARATGATGQIDQDRAFTNPQESEHPAGLGKCQEADMGKLLGELTAVGVVPPDPTEGGAAGQGVVNGLVAVSHGLEDTLVGDVIAQIGGSGPFARSSHNRPV